MVLTYHEAVEAGARELYARDLIPAERALDPEWESLVVGSTGQQWRAIGYRDTIRAVLAAVGYADLRQDQIRRDDARRDAILALGEANAEVERLRFVESNLTSARKAGRSYRDQRDALVATVARVEAVRSRYIAQADDYGNRPAAAEFRRVAADLRAALDPEAS